MAKLNLFHLNVRKSHQPTHMICDDLKQYENAVLSVNEPTYNKKSTKIKGMDIFDKIFYSKLTNVQTRAALCTRGKHITGILISQFSNPDLATVLLNYNGHKFYCISAYLPPDEHHASKLEKLNEAYHNLNQTGLPILILSDTNARSTLWNDRPDQDSGHRGESFEDFVLNNELLIFNDNDVNTFVNNQGGSSTIDLALGNSKLLEFKPIAYVDQDYRTLSDHKRINVTLEPNRNFESSSFCEILTDNPYFARKFEENLEKFKSILDQTNFEVQNRSEADLAVKKLNDYLDKACYNTFPVIKYRKKKPRETNERITTRGEDPVRYISCPVLGRHFS